MKIKPKVKIKNDKGLGIIDTSCEFIYIELPSPGFMDDLLDILLDFERRIVGLIRVSILSPRKILDDIKQGGSTFISPFRLYSLVTTLAIASLVLGHYLDHTRLWSSGEDLIMPPYWNEYLESLLDFSLLVAPVYAFLITIIVITILSAVLFVKQNARLFHHLKFHTYLIGVILFYLALLNTVTMIPYLFVGPDEIGTIFGTIGYLIIALFLVPPFVFYLRGFLAYSGPRGWVTAKAILVMTVTTYSTITIVGRSDIELLHERIFYKKPQVPESQYVSFDRDTKTYVKEEYTVESTNIRMEDDRYIFFTDNWWSDTSEWLVHYQVMDINDSILIRNLVPYPYAQYQGYVDDSTVFLSYDDEMGTSEIANFSDTIAIQASTRHAVFRKYERALWFTAVSEDSTHFLFYDGELKDSINAGPIAVDDFLVINDTLHILSHEATDNRLQKIYVQSMDLDGNPIKQRILFDYDQSTIPEKTPLYLYDYFIHRPQLHKWNDGVVVGYQLMTHYAFEYNIRYFSSSLDLQWEVEIEFPDQLTVFEEFTINKSDLYLLSKDYRLLSSGFRLDRSERLRVSKISLTNQVVEHRVFEPDFGHNLYNGSIYTDPTSMSTSDSIRIWSPHVDHIHSMVTGLW